MLLFTFFSATRPHLKFLTAFFIILPFVSSGQTASGKKKISVNQQRIEHRIFELAKFGREPDGSGNRVAYTKGDKEGRSWFMDMMKAAGLEVTVDYAGNIIGKRKGRNPALKPIAFGSHIDMVPHGGNYDGCVGSIGALEVVETLNENHLTTNHPLEVIIFSNEEGGTIGSSMLIKTFSPLALQAVSQSGRTIESGIAAIGGRADSLKRVLRSKGDLTAFLELHIEQGGTLEKENIQIGVVEGIVGIEDWEVTIEGFANHAGTTPMDSRQDAMLAAAKLVVAVNEVITSHEGRQVGTIGKIAVEPGAYNVIPGKVTLGMEIRDLSQEKIQLLFHEIEAKAEGIAANTGTKISFAQQFIPVHPALTDKTIQEKIAGAAKALGLTYKFMPSGAGHDAQEMASIAPVGMIFVPSMEGISHSPKEFTKPDDMANGANVLLQTILSLDTN